MKPITPLIFLLFCLFASCSKEVTVEKEVPIQENFTEQQQDILDALNMESIPLDNVPLEISDSDLSFLDEIAAARIVGLGEATHGTKEFFQMKHRIFQYLVENHGYTAFAFEMDVAEARIFNDWVQHRDHTDISFLMKEFMNFWTWRTSEVRDLLIWMKEHNNGKEESEMIGFYGVDTQTPKYSIDALAQIMSKVDPNLALTISERTEDYKNIIQQYSENLTDVLVARIKSDIVYVKEEVNNHLSKIENCLGVKEAIWARHLVRHMEQVESVQYDYNRNNRYYLRDLYMAENTTWLFDLLGQNTKMVLWAHNGHIADDHKLGGLFGGSQGNYLKKEYNTDYQIIGFSFSTGSFTAKNLNFGIVVHNIPEEPRKGSVNWFFSKTDLSNFAIKTSSKAKALDTWFRKNNEFLMIGAVYNQDSDLYYRSVYLNTHYDYMIHIDETTASELLLIE